MRHELEGFATRPVGLSQDVHALVLRESLDLRVWP